MNIMENVTQHNPESKDELLIKEEDSSRIPQNNLQDSDIFNEIKKVLVDKFPFGFGRKLNLIKHTQENTWI